MSTVSLDVSKLAETGTWAVEFGGIHLEFGNGAVARLGAAVRRLGCRRVLLVTDPRIRDAGHADRAQRSLAAESVETVLFDGVEVNPTTEHVERGVQVARDTPVDGIVAVGGGSAMDCAKGINFLLTNGGRMEDYLGYGKASRPMLPSVGVPTTAGTGSDAQSYALISQARTHVKMACGAPGARFRAVILDPELLAAIPRDVAAVASIDAVSHAVESFVSTRRNPISQMLSREAWRLLDKSLEPALADAKDLDAQGRMLLGAHLAGAAIEKSMLGAAHACANPLTARYGVVHGIAVGLMLPHVMRFNAVDFSALYDELFAAGSAAGSGQSDLIGRVEHLRSSAGLPARLRDVKVERESLPTLAEDADEQWTARFNPREVSRTELLELYEHAW